MKKMTVTVLVLVSLSFPAAALASGATTGFAGIWTSTDCATWWEENPDGTHDIDCDIWGDGSVIGLQIGPAESPGVIFRDWYATVCANNGSASTQFLAQGIGTHDGDYLNVAFTRAGCGSFNSGGFDDALYHDPGSDTLWTSDPDGDGWGLIWYRVN
jgi:hypothetical protein